MSVVRGMFVVRSMLVVRWIVCNYAVRLQLGGTIVVRL